MTQEYGLINKPTTIKNTQANSINKQVYAVFGNMLRAFMLSPNSNLSEPQSTIDSFISDASFAIRSSYHTTLKATSSAAIFGRDMLFDVPFIADWEEIGHPRRLRVEKDNKRENRRQTPHTYNVGDYCMIRNDEVKRKSAAKYSVPYIITDNGNVHIQCGQVLERINIRRLTLYFGEDAV